MSKARQQANLSSDGNLFADISNDRVGVGSVVPTHKLHVNGTSKFDDDVRLEGTLAARRVIWDKSENAIELGDYTYAKFGLDDDLTVWSNDTASAINNKTGELRILSGTNVRILKRSDAGLGFAAQVANFNIDGACDFYHNGTKRIETTSSGATLTGNLTLDGAIYLPQEIAHYGDTDTNITFPAADTIAFDTGGTERLRINSSGQVSIGNNPTVASDAALHIELDGTREYLRLEGDGGTSNAYIELEAPNNRRKAIIFKSGGTRRGVIGVGDSDEASATSLFFSASSNIAGNSPHMVIDSSGRVLIGTTTEGNESADELTVASSGNTGITIRSGTSSNASIFFTDATSGADEYRGFVQYIQSDDVLKFGTATNERLRITSNGELIQYQNAGAADAAADDLVIGDTTGSVNRGMTIYSHNAQNGSIAFADNDSNFRGAIQYLHNGDRFRILTGGQETLRLQSGGTDGVCQFFMGGITNNNNKSGALTLNHYTFNTYNQIDLIKGTSTSGVNKIEIGGSDSSAGCSAATSIQLYTAANATTNNGTERFRIASDGKVHFGSHASVGANGYILKETSGDYKFNIFASSSTTTNRKITFNSRSNVEAMRIDANGNIGINKTCLLYTSPSPRDGLLSRMPSSA